MPAPQIERTAVYALSPLRWTERGQVMTVPRYGMAKMPANIAALAVARNLADVIGSERVQRMTDAFGIVANVPQPDDLTIDLDQFEAAEPAQGLPRTPPMFEERVGPTRQIVVDAGMV